MELLTVIIALFCIAAGTFAIGVISGSKIGSNYTSNIVLKTAGVFAGAGVFALCLGVFVGFLLKESIKNINDWIPFIFLFLVGIRLILESMEKAPSLKYTDIVKNNYLIKVAAQSSMDIFFLGFIVSRMGGSSLFVSMVFCGIMTFFAMMLGFSQGHASPRTVLGSRLQLAAGIILVLLALSTLLSLHN